MWKADVNLSVTMTFCSSVASFACTTFWIWLFGTYLLEADSNIQLPYLQLFVSLISFVIPIFVGLFVTYKNPALSKKLTKFCRPFFVVLIFVYTTLGIYANRFFFYVTSWQHFVAPACLGFSGYIVGFICANVLCLSRNQSIALSIEAAIQNVSIAVAVLQFNLASPYGDMALMPVIGYLLTATGPPQLTMLAIWKLKKILWDKKEKGEDIPMNKKSESNAVDNAAFS